MAESMNTFNWGEGDSLDFTADPNISVTAMQETAPEATVATIVGVCVVVVVAIVIVFVLGIFIDCRHQRLTEKKLAYLRKTKGVRVVKINSENENASIAANMEEPGTSVPPAATLRNIP